MVVIQQTSAYFGALEDLVEPTDVLQKHGYLFEYLTEAQLLQKTRCSACCKVVHPTRISLRQAQNIVPRVAITEALERFTLSSARPHSTPEGSLGVITSAAPPVLENKFNCKFHPGQIVNRHWTCCAQYIASKPCGGTSEHSPRSYYEGELHNLYQMHETSNIEAVSWRPAVAIDCEMGTSAAGDSEVIRVTLIDYFTSEILVDSIVEPDVPMRGLNSRISGVTWADIKNAKRERRCLFGKGAARQAIWKYVNSDTIVVGHSAHNDLRALRWIHDKVVDSYVIEDGIRRREEAEKKSKQGGSEDGEGGKDTEGLTDTEGDVDVPKPAPKERKTSHSERPRTLSLKTLARLRLGRDIQVGRNGHDSIEDAIAARDLVHWHITHPDAAGHLT